MKVKLLTYHIIFYNLFPSLCIGQVLSLGYGQMYFTSKTIEPIIHQYNETNNEQYYSLDLALIEIEKILLGTELSTYEGVVDFNASGDLGIGFGSSRTRLFRISPYAGFIINPNRKFRIIPYFKIIIEKSVITGLSSSISLVAEVDSPNGYTGKVYVEPINRWQIAPGAGLMLSWNPIGRIHLIGNMYYTYGYRPFQKYYFEYSFQGVEQPTGEWHANGTGVFTSIGLGWKLWNNNKDLKKQ